MKGSIKGASKTLVSELQIIVNHGDIYYVNLLDRRSLPLSHWRVHHVYGTRCIKYV